MTWARLDDGFWRNEKVIACSDAALGLHVRAISYCANQLTDGVLTKAALTMLRASPKRVTELVDAGLWDITDDAGQAIHDYLVYNPSRLEVEAELAKKQAAGKAGGLASARARAQAKSKPVPVPSRPDPISTAAATAREAISTSMRAVENLTGSLNKTITDAILAELDGGTSAEWIVAACEEAALANVRNWKYVAAILKRWRVDGFRTDSRSNGVRSQGTRNHRGKPEESGDWVQAIIAEQRRTDAALGRPDRNAPGDAAAVLEQDV